MTMIKQYRTACKHVNWTVYHIPIPQVSQSTISFGTSESSRLHLIQMMSVVVSSTAEHIVYLFINNHGSDLDA